MTDPSSGQVNISNSIPESMRNGAVAPEPPPSPAMSPTGSLELEGSTSNDSSGNSNKGRASGEKDLETEAKHHGTDGQAPPSRPEYSDEEWRLLRKIDWLLLPAIWLVYFLSFMDRTNIGNALIAGMARDLSLGDEHGHPEGIQARNEGPTNLGGSRYFLAVVLFQIGYAIAEIPCNMILARSRPSVFIPVIMLLWGTACTATASVQTWQQLVGARFVLGVCEAGFAPATMFIISSWYRPNEQAKRFLVPPTAGTVSGIVGGLLAGAITEKLNGTLGLAGWRWLFVIEGCMTISCAFFIPFVLLDFPLTTSDKKMSPEERQLAYERLRADGVTSRDDDETKVGHWRALCLTVSDWRVWMLSAGYMAIIGSLALGYYYPTFVMSMGYDRVESEYMTAPIYAVAVCVAIPLCIVADRYTRYRGPLTAGALLFLGTVPSAVASVVKDPHVRYGLICLINAGLWTGAPLGIAFSSNVLGPVAPEVRAIALAMINGSAHLANLYSTYVLSISHAPYYSLGFSVFSIMMAAGAVIYLAGFFIFRRWPCKPTPS